MSRLAESVAGTLSQGLAAESARPIESETSEMQALALARQLRASFEEFFRQSDSGPAAATSPSLTATPAHARENAQNPSGLADTPYAPLLGESLDRRRRPLAEQDDLFIQLTLAVGRCRASRQSLGVVLLAAEGVAELTPMHADHLQRVMKTTCRDLDAHTDAIERPGQSRLLLIVPARERMEAVAHARSLVEQLRRAIAQLHQAGLLPACVAAAGVAWVATPAKNFRPMSLMETAERCLAAALASGGVKSLEVS
jgi:hypothetical protein